MLRTWNQAVLDAWALVFNQILQKVPYNVIAKEAEETLLSISEQSQHTMSKYIAAKMIGFIADVIAGYTHFLTLNRITYKTQAFFTIGPKSFAKTMTRKLEE